MSTFKCRCGAIYEGAVTRNCPICGAASINAEFLVLGGVGSKTRVFQNPANGHQERVTTADAWLTFFFGLFYLLVKGLWGHAAIWLAICVFIVAAGGGPILILLVPGLWIGYALTIRDILANRYLRSGWMEISGDGIRTAEHSEEIPGAINVKKCPFCAEEILAEAIRCKHCKSDLVST